MTGLFYVLIALGLAFVVWGDFNQKKLIDFENKIIEYVLGYISQKKASEKKRAPRVVKSQKPRGNYPADMPRTAA